MGLLNIGRYAADTPDPAPSGRFVSHPNVVNRLADAYRRRPYSNTITARPMYAIAPTGEQNDIREERGLYHARWYVADEPCGQHGEEREVDDHEVRLLVEQHVDVEDVPSRSGAQGSSAARLDCACRATTPHRSWRSDRTQSRREWSMAAPTDSVVGKAGTDVHWNLAIYASRLPI